MMENLRASLSPRAPAMEDPVGVKSKLREADILESQKKLDIIKVKVKRYEMGIKNLKREGDPSRVFTTSSKFPQVRHRVQYFPRTDALRITLNIAYFGHRRHNLQTRQNNLSHRKPGHAGTK